MTWHGAGTASKESGILTEELEFRPGGVMMQEL